MEKHSWERPFTPTLPFLYVHGGMKEVCDRKDFNDPTLPRGVADYVQGGDGEEVAARLAAARAAAEGLLLHRRQPAAALAGAATGAQAPVAQARPDRQRQLPHVLDRSRVRRAAAGRRATTRRSASSIRRVWCRTSSSATRRCKPMEDAKSEFAIFAMLAQQAPGARPRARRASRSRITTASSATTPTSSRSTGWTASMEAGNEEAAMDHIIQTSSVTEGLHLEGRAGARRAADPGHRPLRAAQLDLQRLRAGRHRLPAAVVRREEGAVADAHRPAAVPARSSVVRRDRRGAAGAQGAADGRRQLSAAA